MKLRITTTAFIALAVLIGPQPRAASAQFDEDRFTSNGVDTLYNREGNRFGADYDWRWNDENGWFDGTDAWHDNYSYNDYDLPSDRYSSLSGRNWDYDAWDGYEWESDDAGFDDWGA